MPSAYLDSSEYDTFGLPSTVTDGHVMQASALIDGYLRRPQGLAYLTDQDGTPCAMQGATPRMTYTLAALSPGNNVTVTVTPANATQDLVGEVMVVDLDATSIEALVISAVPAKNQLTFQTVKYSHSSGAKGALGMVITEERALPGKRSVARTMQQPMVSMVSALGRYGYGRRGDNMAGPSDINLLAMVQTFGGPPQWFPIDVANCGYSAGTGEVWIPAGGLMAYFSEVRMHYIAGFPADSIPLPIKSAVATLVDDLVTAVTTNATLSSDIKSLRVGDTEIVRVGNSQPVVVQSSLDRDTLNLIAPYRAMLFA
jgi:hypothetical protein